MHIKYSLHFQLKQKKCFLSPLPKQTRMQNTNYFQNYKQPNTSLHNGNSLCICGQMPKVRISRVNLFNHNHCKLLISVGECHWFVARIPLRELVKTFAQISWLDVIQPRCLTRLPVFIRWDFQNTKSEKDEDDHAMYILNSGYIRAFASKLQTIHKVRSLYEFSSGTKNNFLAWAYTQTPCSPILSVYLSS